MSDNMIERVKAAIAGAQDAGSREGDYLRVYDGTMDLSAMARAAIAAMREPTAAMIAEGHALDPLACDVSEDAVAYVYGRIFKAMIDAAVAPEVVSTEGKQSR